jgi:hypothetical protein
MRIKETRRQRLRRVHRIIRVKQPARHHKIYHRYLKHLPEIPLDAPSEPGRIYHLVQLHRRWCGYFKRYRSADCDCWPIYRRFVEPSRH